MDVLALALRVIFSLGAVIGVLWLAQRYFARATGLRGKASDPLNVISRRGIGQKSALVVVEMDGKRFMLGVTDQSINVLHTGEVPEPATVPETAAQSFSRTLASVPGGPEVDEQGIARHRRAARQPGALDGSILSLGTWVRAGQALGAMGKGTKG